MSLVAAALVACRGGTAASDEYRCDVSQTLASWSGTASAGPIHVTASASRSSAVQVDPRTGRRTYVATLRYEVGQGQVLGLERRLSTTLGADSPKAGAYLDHSVYGALAFVYERGTVDEAREILDHGAPPAGWNRLVVGLRPEVAGSLAVDLPNVTRVGATLRAGFPASLTITADGRFTVSRGWIGTVDVAVPGWVGERFGVPVGWTGRLATGYELRFDREQRPVQLRTVAERETSGRLHQVTTVLDLSDTDPRTRTGLLAAAFADALSLGPSSDLLFFGTGRRNRAFWRVLSDEATLVTATYDVAATSSGLALDAGFAAGEFQSRTERRRLAQIRIVPPGGAQVVDCTGSPALPDAGKPQPQRAPVLDVACVPAAAPVPDATPVATGAVDPSATATPGDPGCVTPSKHPELSLDADALSLGEEPVHADVLRQELGVHNNGGGDLHVRAVTVTGPHRADFRTTTTCTGHAIEPGERCDVTVQFVPAEAGPRTATLVLDHDAGEPAVVPLNGVGGPGPDLAASDLEVRDDGTLGVTVANVGDADAGPSTTTVTFTPGGTVTAATGALAAGESVTVTVAIPAGCLAAGCDVEAAADRPHAIVEHDGHNNATTGVVPAAGPSPTTTP